MANRALYGNQMTQEVAGIGFLVPSGVLVWNFHLGGWDSHRGGAV